MNTTSIWEKSFDKLSVDSVSEEITFTRNGKEESLSLYSEEAFQALSKLWLTVGWSRKYSYAFSWLGRPVIQTPEDLIRYQETLFEVKPDVVIETGIAHGGSLVFVASILKLLGKGRVVGIDVDIRAHNRKAIEEHPLFPLMTLHEGSSSDPAIRDDIKSKIEPGETVLVTLDSCHTREHVLDELRLYADLVTPGSYIIVADGLMKHICGVPGTKEWFAESNPISALDIFLQENSDFIEVDPPQHFNESTVEAALTYHPRGWLKRVK